MGVAAPVSTAHLARLRQEALRSGDVGVYEDARFPTAASMFRSCCSQRTPPPERFEQGLADYVSLLRRMRVSARR